MLCTNLASMRTVYKNNSLNYHNVTVALATYIHTIYPIFFQLFLIMSYISVVCCLTQ